MTQDPKLILPEENRVDWDKEAPKGPPTPMEIFVEPWFQPVFDYMKSIVDQEGLLANLAVQKAVEIVQFNHDRGLVGIDYFPEAGGGGAVNRASIVSMAVPLGVELYRQALASIGERKHEFQEIVQGALEKRPGATP